MKVKNLEKEMDACVKRMLKDLSNALTLYEVYMKEASGKRQAKFEKKLEKKYGKAVYKLDKRIDNFPW